MRIVITSRFPTITARNTPKTTHSQVGKWASRPTITRTAKSGNCPSDRRRTRRSRSDRDGTGGGACLRSRRCARARLPLPIVEYGGWAPRTTIAGHAHGPAREQPVTVAVPRNIAGLVGRTPMVELTQLTEGREVTLFAKLESFNPGGSVKDRIGVAMIEAAEQEGRIEPGRTTIVEATSGNTGIALAFVCAAKGYDLILTLPEGMSRERESLLAWYGATVQVTESMGGMNEAVEAARRLAGRDDVFLPDQFSNPANPDIHRTTTGPELWDALDGRIDVFVAGVGTGGTITGVGELLKARNPSCRIVAVEPRTSAVLSGGPPGPHKIQGIGAGFVPEVLNREVLDEVIAVDDEDALQTARRLARREGVLAGLSCGAAVFGALELSRRRELRGARIATILPDSGERYVSTPFFAP